MIPELSGKEERFVRDLLTWDRTERSAQWVLCYLFLILGLVVFVAAAFITLQHLNDRTALWVLFPGSLIAMLFFAFYAVGERWVRKRHFIATVLKKLCSEI